MLHRRIRRQLISFLLTLTAIGVLPVAALAAAGSGGGGLGGVSGSTGVTGLTGPLGTTTPTAASGNVPVSASGSGLTVSTRSSAQLRQGLTFTGTSTEAVGTQIEIERAGRETGWLWAPTVATTVAAGGTFTATWATNHIGQFAIRAVAMSSLEQPEAETSPLTSTVYLQTKATLYGPGLYGNKTACGQKLTKTTIGVANRTLRCGESVAVFYDGRTLDVPVIDRGPFANGANYDLTEATGAALGMDGTAEIGAVSLPKVPADADGEVRPEPAP